MELQTCSLACVGDSALPFVILGAIVIALIMLVVSFVLMKRRK